MNESKVVRTCSDLIRINTSNPSHNEALAADYIATFLRSLGIQPQTFTPVPGRTSVTARLAGRNPSLPPLLVHTHLDVVPAVDGQWSEDPFAGKVKDGYVWGRGAVDMKNMVAAVLTVVELYQRAQEQPARDLVLAFFADEEAGGKLGAGYLVRERPELFADCREAIGEVGGFSFDAVPGTRAYLVGAAEKGVVWSRLTSRGTPGHASMLNPHNPVHTLCLTIAHLVATQLPTQQPTTMRLFFRDMAKIMNADSEQEVLQRLGSLSRMVQAAMQDTLAATVLDAGQKINVIPAEATALVDGRFLPGHGAVLSKLMGEAVGDAGSVDQLHYAEALESPWKVPLTNAMQEALAAEDPGAVAVPFMSSAFTDAKWLTELGIKSYGFCPLLLERGLDFSALFHGVNERVSVDALEFSVRVLKHLFDHY
jgi:acetylornithine deacetylase/succinyl-diaminopimelate desuccinylase-like protein